MIRIILCCLMIFMAGCNTGQQDSTHRTAKTQDSLAPNTSDLIKADTISGHKMPIAFNGNNRIETGKLQPVQLLDFAETMVGTPYLYGSTDPSKGLDCSGFITYVFNHFNVAVPRSSIDFTNIEHEVPLSEARPGDLVLFTGTDSTNPAVGHMGIVRRVEGESLDFIHSTSGKAYGVTITPLTPYYMSRFVKILRIFPG